MNTILKNLLIVGILGALLSISTASAQIGGGMSSPSYWKKVGGIVKTTTSDQAVEIYDLEVTHAFTLSGVISGAFDLNGNELTLDADGDTSITADTDDQIDIEINNADDFQFTANLFSALSGSIFTSDDLDATTASTLLLGKSTATKVEIADSGVETNIQGTTAFDESGAFGGWGYTGEHIALSDASSNTNAGLGEYFEISSSITAGKVMAAEYSRLMCRTAQTNQSTLVGTESQFRLYGVNLADGVHAGLWAVAEQSGTSTLSGGGTFDAISATVETAAGFTAGATEQVSGITIDSSVNASATINASTNFSGIYIKSNGKDWFDGIKITGVANDISLQNSETIDNASDGDITLTGVGGSNNEDLIFDFETTANTIGVGTSTGVTTWDFGTIGISSGSIGSGNIIMSSAQPTLNFDDTDASDHTDNATIYANATDAGSGTEDVDVVMSQYVGGALTEFLNADADGSLTLGQASQAVAFNSSAISGITTLGMGGDLSNYEDAIDANTRYNMGTSATERVFIQSLNATGTKTLEEVLFQTDTASASADYGKFRFNVDGTDILQIDDDGIEMLNSKIFTGNVTGALTGNADTCTTASAGDAAVDFFGAGVDAVTDATTCTDIEGTGLSITTGVLNVDDDYVLNTGDTVDGLLAVTVTNAGILDTQVRLQNFSNTVGTGSRISFRMQDSNSATQTYGRIATEIDVNTATAEDGTMRLSVFENGTATDYLILNGNTATISATKNLTLTTGKNITLGTTQWNSGDEMDGTKIKDADYGDVTIDAAGDWDVGNAATVTTITGLAPDTATTQATQAAITSLGTLTALTMGGDINLDGSNIDNGGVIFLKEQVDADADVAGSGQLWIDTATPNVFMFTDDAGNDRKMVYEGGTGGLDWTSNVGTIHTGNYVENVSTALSMGTVGVNTIAITSDSGADDVTLPAATVSTAGMLTTAKWGEIVANNAKVTNATHTGEVTGATALTIADSISVASWTIASPTFTTGITATGLIVEDHFAASLVFDDGDLLDFGTFVTGNSEGLMLPAHATDCSTATAEGQVCWEEDAKKLYIGDGAAAVDIIGAAGANTALSNLVDVAINLSLVSGTYNTDDLGTSAKGWRDLYLGNTAVIDWTTAASTSDMTLTHSANLLTFAGGAVDVNGAFTASTVAADTTITGTTITASTGFALGTTDYVGITGNERLVFNEAGTIVVTGAILETSGNIELGHATATTLSGSGGVLSVEGVVIPSISSTNTFTNKRITARVGTTADAATITPVGDSNDMYTVTALAQAATIAAPSGTPTNGQKLVIRIKDNGTTRALTWNAIYNVVGVTLPTDTTAGKTHYIGCMYNTANSKWDVLAIGEEA